MPRTIQGDESRPLTAPQLDLPGVAVDPVPLWAPPKGLDYITRINRVANESAVQMSNLYLDRGLIRSRLGTEVVGTRATEPVMAVINFIIASGIGFLLRFTTKRVEQFTGGVWSAVSSDVFTGGEGNYFTFTAWNNTLLISNGVDGMWEYNPDAGSFGKIPGAPSAIHLTTVGGRVIASGANNFPSKIQWSVKNNSRDWTGIGSGNEDLLSTPGGKVDLQLGAYPISDAVTLLVRSNSTWQMTETGNVNAPFRFARLYENLGTRSPNSVARVPGGIVLLGTDDVYFLNEREVSSIGTNVKDRFFTEFTDLSKVFGEFVPTTKDYWLSHGDTVYRYSTQDKGWSRHVYPFNIRWIGQAAFHKTGLTIDELQGTIDQLVGTIDSLTGPPNAGGVYLAVDTALGYVLQQKDTGTDNIMSGSSAVAVDSEIEIISGMLRPKSSSVLDKTTIIEAQMEHECELAQALGIDYSVDGGATWGTYVPDRALTITTKPTILSFRETLSAQSIQLRLRSSTLGRLILSSLVPMMVKGPRVHP